MHKNMQQYAKSQANTV